MSELKSNIKEHASATPSMPQSKHRSEPEQRHSRRFYPTTQNYSSYYNMYYMLSIIVWFFLCVGVVMKHNSLIDIFYSFVACSAMAVVLIVTSSLQPSTSSQRHKHDLTTSTNRTTKTASASFYQSSASDKRRPTRNMMLIGNMIGVLACSIQVAMILIHARNRRNTVSSPMLSSILPTYSVAAGYLVFDQWYTFCMIHWFTSHRKHMKKNDSSTSRNDASATIISYSSPWSNLKRSKILLWHQQPNYKSLYSILEDAVTLIVILIALVQNHQQHHTFVSDDGVNHHRTWNIYMYGLVLLWPIYKLCRLMSVFVCLLKRSSTNNDSITKASAFHEQNTTAVTTNDDTHLRNRQDTSTANNDKTDRHIASSTMIWRIYGKEYDLTNFVREHPGGYEAIMLGCNRDDCTALFRSYHPSPISYRHATKVLQSYRIDTNTNNDKNSDDCTSKGNELSSLAALASSALPTIQNTQVSKLGNDDEATSNVDEFYDLLCERVTKELWDRHEFHILKDRTATPRRVAYYTFVTLGVLVSAYNYGIRGSSIVFGSIPFAIFGWLFGALGHDAGHYTVCRTFPIVNDICVWAMCLLCNPIVWQHQHTFGHHSHTNDISHDPDLHHFTTLLRVHEKFQYYSVYRYQKHPVYVFFAYMFVVFGTCIWIPFGIIQEGSLYGIVEWTDRCRPMRTIGMYTHLIVYIIFIVIVPFFVYKNGYMAWLAVTTHISLSGIIFAIFSQINHLNEASLQCTSHDNEGSRQFTMGSSNNNDKHAQKAINVQDSWSVQQIKASNNFCPQSVLWHYISNGLNLQIEHHLFPGINHCHLPKIQPIVQEMCREYGVPYKCYDSWCDIMMVTLDWLDRLSALSCKHVRTTSLKACTQSR